jgi:short-subunit dehydrogenase
MRIENKVVLITGASEGIGAACAGVFRRRGARLCLTARSLDKLQSAAGPSDLIVASDLLEGGAPERVVAETVARFGRLDVLINNAGAGLYTPAHDSPPELARRLFDLNFFAPLELIRHAVPHMRKQGGGAIVNISSIAGAVSLPWFTLYSASKSAMIALTDGLRIELRRDSIHCMSVCPGYVRTNFQRNILAGEVPPALGPMRQRWAITAEQCAEDIANGLERDSRTVVTPRTGWLLIAFARLFPRLVDRRLEMALQRRNLKEGSPQA